ncbi:MAG TPA: hypothetical protein VFA70_02090, partial [Dehalococcoidia bacterium]|nr:hypothetical protein [Dehalococcoidia bacterium]
MVRDPRVERFLDQRHVPWRYEPAIPLDEFDIEGGLRNQARLDTPLDTDLAVEYGQAMELGGEFPAVVGVRRPHGLILPVGGNHRLAAARLIGRAAFDCYLLETTNELVIARLTRSLNSIEGKRPNRAEALAQAEYFVRHLGQTRADAAAALGIPVTWIERHLAVSETIERLGDYGGTAAARAAKWSLARLGAIPNDTVLKAAATLVVESRLTSGEVEDLVKRVRAERTEAAQLAAVQQLAQRPDLVERRVLTRGGATRPPRLPKSELFRALQMVVGLCTRFATPDALGLSGSEDTTRLRQLWAEAAGRMEVLLGIRGIRDPNGGAPAAQHDGV